MHYQCKMCGIQKIPENKNRKIKKEKKRDLTINQKGVKIQINIYILHIYQISNSANPL